MGCDMTQLITDTAHATLDNGKSININMLHNYLGHPGESILRATAKTMGLKLTGSLDTCKNCAMGKARQANLNKDPVPRSPK